MGFLVLLAIFRLFAFNTNGIIYDNSPWRPGRDILNRESEEDERKLKNLATKVMSNGVEVLVKEKNSDGKQEQRKLKFMHHSSPTHQHVSSRYLPKKSLLSSAVATVVNHQQVSAMFPLHQLMQHNYIIKTCMTTYTYLTTVVQNKRSVISTFETIVSVVTTESLTNLYASDVLADIKPTKTKYMDIKTIKPTVPTSMYASNFPKIDKRIDNEDENEFDLIQPSELGQVPCKTSCSCSHTKTEGLKTKFPNIEASAHLKYAHKTSKYTSKLNLRPTSIEMIDKKTQYGPYEFEISSHITPTDKIVEKYTEVINDFSDEKDSNTIKESELLTNEQAPIPPKNKLSNSKHPDKSKPEKPQKPNKNKFVVADLLKLGSLGIKGLSQLAPVIEKMTGGFIKRQEAINKTTTTSTIKPSTGLTAYNVNKRVDNDLDLKANNFPIYIPVDELETSESQIVFTNATLHQNLVWAAEHKQLPPYIVPPRIVHESPLVNGGIPISPGEIITANSDVIVGKPAVGRPLTLAASGIKFHNPVSPPNIDSLAAGNEEYIIEDRPLNDPSFIALKVDDSFDLRPPEVPKIKHKPNWGHGERPHNQNFSPSNKAQNRYPTTINTPSDHLMKTEHLKNTQTILGNHGRPAFLDFIPSLVKATPPSLKHHNDFIALNEDTENVPDSNPSSSEIVHTRVKTNDNYDVTENKDSSKQFLVDIQPSRVANVLIPHGSSTALVFAGSSEPHKTGDYVDDPLPYPQPGYFGSFSIDAPHMTNVHNVAPNNNKPFIVNPSVVPLFDSYKPSQQTPKNYPYRTDLKLKWKDSKHTNDYKIPPPTSNQETFVQVGPKITAYNPDVYNPNNGDFEKYNHVRSDELKINKGTFDREYEKYLAVPPPPPPKMHFHSEIISDKNKIHIPHPIIHTKPIQDMKVFLNIQHPVPNTSNPESAPPKVTSEIYFAAQAPNNKPTPTYTFHIPPASPSPMYSHHFSSNVQSSTSASHVYNTHSLPSTTSSTGDKSVQEMNEKENTYTVTLNTATSVASKGDEVGQVIGSSISVPVSVSSNNGPLNADIPIKTNFAIRVEDTPSVIENQESHNNNLSNVYKESIDVGTNVNIEDNQWNKNKNIISQSQQHSSAINNKPNQHSDDGDKFVDSSTEPSINSHANFPMINEYTNAFDNVKPVTEYQEEDKVTISPRPAKHIPNIPTNSHGWYSSVLVNDNSFNKINIESTTRRIIPLSQEYNSNKETHFGEKLSGIGKPPSEIWHQNSARKPEHISFSIGKPFTKPNIDSLHKPAPAKYSKVNYIPSNFGSIKQPVYDIPIKDDNMDTTTDKPKTITEKLKPVYENSEEIYDGEDLPENNGELDGEVSLESMKIPVVSSSIEFDTVQKPSSTELTLLQDEIFDSLKQIKDEKNVKFEFNPGTQTEKPFKLYNNSSDFTTNIIKPVITENSNQYSQKPRPFTNTAVTLDHQLQQSHWQINQLMENSTNMSYEENLELNIGEEMSTIISSTKRPLTIPRIPPLRHFASDVKYKRPLRPIFTHPKNVSILNDSNIITSTVHIQEKTPFTVEKNHQKSTMRPYLIGNSYKINRTSTEIIDLSPPPPTLDYNFKPSPNDEMIMGMSPPPPRTPSVIRPQSRPSMTSRPMLPIRTPAPYRTKPPRTPPPKIPITQRPIRKPISHDEASTYRPKYELPSNIRRPTFNREQPSSQLQPPREIPSQINDEILSPTEKFDMSPHTNIVFPTPISSGWLTSSGVDFSSNFNFGPTSIQFPEVIEATKSVESITSSSKNPELYDVKSSSENYDIVVTKKPATEDRLSTTSNELSTESITTSTIKSTTNNDILFNDSLGNKSHQDNSTRDTVKVLPISYRNRTRQPYPIHNEDKKINTNKFKLPAIVTPIIKPTRTLNRPGISYPTRHLSTRKIIRPLPTRSSSDTAPANIAPSSVIESSETFIDDSIIKQTELIKESSTQNVVDKTILEDKTNSNEVTPLLEDHILSVKPTHHAGNEIKISDEVIPTKTEFRTTIVTLTKTLSEPPKTVSSVNYVNVTHTLTVTRIMTSLISQSEGARTQTLVLTNTHTSTVVDVVTEVHTQVQPTTIIETVTKHVPIPQVEPSTVKEEPVKTQSPLDDISMSYEENDNLVNQEKGTTENIQKIETDNESDSDTFFVVMNKSQNGGQSPPINSDIDTGDYDGVTRNEEVNSNGVSQVLFGEILLAGTPYLETTNILNLPGVTYSKECHPDCKASRNERCQRIDGIMKCVCRPGFARMFPDRPCKPTYTYSVKLALGSKGNKRLEFHENLSDNSSQQYHELAVATHEGINRMVMQSDLRDVYHGVHITGFQPLEMNNDNEKKYQGVMNEFYVQLSDNAHESRLKEVIEKYLRNNNYSLGGTDVHAAADFVHKLDVTDFNECLSSQFHDCSEHAKCYNLNGTYTCSCLEGYADLSVNKLYPGRICSTEPVGCERCNYHGACYTRDDRRVLCECFQWYAGSSCQINLKVVLISLVVAGALLSVVLAVCAILACSRPRKQPRSIVACIQSMPSIHQAAVPSKQRADRRALISERGEPGDASSIQNASLPYMPSKQRGVLKSAISAPPTHEAPVPPPPAVLIPRARLHPLHGDSRENISKKLSLELSSEAKLISYLESGAVCNNDEMRRKHSMESSYSAHKDRHNKQGALVSAGFKVSTTIRPDDMSKDDRDDLSSAHKGDLDDLTRFGSLRKSYSHEDLSEWTDAERRIGELTLSEARSIGGTLPASTGRAASSTRLTHQEANTMAERDLGSTFLLPHVHLYKPDLTSDVSEFDSL